MKKIIEEVLQIEEKVGLELKEARKEASEMRSAAEKDVADRVNNANKQAREMVQSAVENAKVEAKSHRTEKLKEAEQGKGSFLSENAGKIDELVDNIVDIVLGCEGKAN